MNISVQLVVSHCGGDPVFEVGYTAVHARVPTRIVALSFLEGRYAS